MWFLHKQQIIKQEQLYYFNIDIVAQILQYSKNHKSNTFYFLVDSTDFKLRPESLKYSNDRPLRENFKFSKILWYEKLLNDFSSKKFNQLPRFARNISNNIFFLQIIKVMIE